MPRARRGARPRRGVQVSNRLRPWLPLLLALTANSAIYRNADTGHASWRSVLWARWPSAGPPPHFDSAAEYDAACDDAATPARCSTTAWSIGTFGPSANFPTVEVRVADVPATVAETVLFATLVRALVMTALADGERGEPVPPLAAHVLKAAYWTAARYGLDGERVDLPGDRALRPARTCCTAWSTVSSRRWTRSATTTWCARRSARVPTDGNGAMRQRRAWRAPRRRRRRPRPRPRRRRVEGLDSDQRQFGERRAGRLRATRRRGSTVNASVVEPSEVRQHRGGRRRHRLGVHRAGRVRTLRADQPHLVDRARLGRRDVVHHQHAGVPFTGEHDGRGAAGRDLARHGADVGRGEDLFCRGRLSARAATRCRRRPRRGRWPPRRPRRARAVRHRVDCGRMLDGAGASPATAASSASRSSAGGSMRGRRGRSSPSSRARRGPRRRTRSATGGGTCGEPRSMSSTLGLADRVQRVRRREDEQVVRDGSLGDVTTPRHLRRPRMRVTHPRLDGGKVRRQTLGYLHIGQAVVIRELDALALGVGQRVQALATWRRSSCG